MQHTPLREVKPGARLFDESLFRDGFVPLSFDPHFSVGKVLLLPDWDQALQLVDAFERRFKSRLTMRRGDDHRHAGFTDLHPAQPVNHRDPTNRMRTRDLASDLGEHLDSHRLGAILTQGLGGPAFWVCWARPPRNSPPPRL